MSGTNANGENANTATGYTPYTPGKGFAAAAAAIEAGHESSPPRRRDESGRFSAGEGQDAPADEQHVSGEAPASPAADDAAEGTDPAGPDDQDAGQDDGTQSEEHPGETYTVTVNGKTQQVKLDELISGYQNASANTRKSQELSAQLGEVDKVKKEVGTTRDQLTKELGVLRQVLANSLPNQQTMQQALAENRTADYLTMQKQWEEFRVIVNRLEGLQADGGRETAEAHQARLQDELKLLVDKQPAFKDEATQKEVAEMLLEDGFSRDEVMAIADHRQLLIVWQAMQYRKGMAKGLKARSDLEKAPKLGGQPAARQKADTLKNQLINEGQTALARTGRVPDSMKGAYWGRHLSK